MITWIMSLAVGICLSAACGFRVFVPPLVVSIGALSGYVSLDESMAWLGTWPAVLCLGTATVLEIGAYYIPWLDHLLDTIAVPASMIAGTVLSASFLVEMDPMLQWGLAALMGGGSAGIIQAGTSLLRIGSTATTGGLANPVVSTAENAGALITSLLAFVIPMVMAGVLVGTFVLIGWLLWRRWKRAH